jgi:predicted DNA-binding protein
MKRTMIYLPEDIHQGLRELAFEHNTSIAALIRKAVKKVYGEDIEDIRDMDKALAEYKAHPESFVSLDELRRRKKLNV